MLNITKHHRNKTKPVRAGNQQLCLQSQHSSGKEREKGREGGREGKTNTTWPQPHKEYERDGLLAVERVLGNRKKLIRQEQEVRRHYVQESYCTLCTWNAIVLHIFKGQKIRLWMFFKSQIDKCLRR